MYIISVIKYNAMELNTNENWFRQEPFSRKQTSVSTNSIPRALLWKYRRMNGKLKRYSIFTKIRSLKVWNLPRNSTSAANRTEVRSTFAFCSGKAYTFKVLLWESAVQSVKVKMCEYDAVNCVRLLSRSQYSTRHYRRRIKEFLKHSFFTVCVCVFIANTKAFSTQTPGKYPKQNILHIKHGESLKSTKSNLDQFRPCSWLFPFTAHT
jgi:hypothetical protein